MLSMAKKAEIFEAKLSQEDLIILAYIVKKDVEFKTWAIRESLDTSITAALYELTDMSIEEAKEVITKTAEYMKSSESFLLKYREEWVMKLTELEPKIKEECIKILDKNVKNQAEAVKALKTKFIEVSPKDLGNIFKETKSEWMKPKEVREKIEAQNKAELEEKEVSNVITPKEEEKGNTEPVQSEKERLLWLNNIFRPTKFQGTFNNYEKVDEGLKVGSKVFTDLEELKKYKSEELAEMQKQIDFFNSKIEEIEAAFEYLHMR